MSKYIDADKVKEYILSTGFYCDTEADRKYSAELIDELFPTADVQEVVRCRDCKWFGDIGCAIRIVDDSDRPSENDFCSFAERKDNG